MPDPSYAAAPPDELRRELLREAIPLVVPGWRPLAENVLGAETRIDWVGLDAEGAVVLALAAVEPGEDMALVAHGLAQRAWLSARLADWVQLAPAAGLLPDARVQALLLAPAFRPAALEAMATQADLRPALLRFIHDTRGDIRALVEPFGASPPGAQRPRPNGNSGFRSGLSAADLDLSAEELTELES